MADVSKIKLPSGNEYNIKDARITGVDSTPTSGSTNVVTSDGIYNQLTKKFDHVYGGWCAGSGSYWGKIFEYANDGTGTIDVTSTFLFTEYGTGSNGYSAILMIDARGNSKQSISNIKANWVYKTSDTIENTIKVTHCYQNNTFYIRIYAYSSGWGISIAGTLLQARGWSASSKSWSGFEATYTGNDVESFSQIPTDETLVTITNKIIEASGFKTPNGTISQFLKADGSVDSNTYLTSHQSLSNYVKVDPGATEQNIKSGISTLNKGVINLYRDSGDHYTFLGFSNGAAEKYLGGIGFKSQADHELYLKLATSTNTPSTTYYKILNENNHAAPGVTAGTAGTSSATSGATLAVPYVTVNSAGHVTGYGTHTHTISGFSTSDTKNTTGSTDTSSKIFLVGATTQAANPQTYSDNEIYATSGVLTTKSVQVGGTAATMQYNSTDSSIEFVFS